MDNITKFDGLDYNNTFASKIKVMHTLIKDIMSDQLCDGDTIIDMGGGPGIGAKLIDELGIKATVTNIEPSTMIYDIPELSTVDYIPIKISLQEARDARMPVTADCLLMVSSAHEIALCNNASPLENKKIFFQDLDSFIKTNLKSDGIIIIGFPNYKKGSSRARIASQRRLIESILGHSHPPEELFTIEEFSSAFGTQPIVAFQRPMDLANGDHEDTILMANAAIFITG